VSDLNDSLIDAPLVADNDADQELGGDAAVALSDQEIQGARVRLLCRTVERIDGADDVAVALTAEFQPAPATRFTHATVVLEMTMPEQTQIIEVAPTEVRTPDPITFKVTKSGKISLKKVVDAELGSAHEVSYSIYPCVVRGSGAASKFASWSFEEHVQTAAGIGQSQDLILTLAGSGPFSADVRVSARLLKPGVSGALQRVRDLILGPNLQSFRTRTVTFAPSTPQPKKRGFFSFLG
jgi:hypothetical protein